MDHDWSEDILVAKLPAEPRTSDELSAVTELALGKPRFDLLVDIGAVEEPTYQTLCELMKLHSMLGDRGRCCMFCNVSAATRRIFKWYGFDRIFRIADTSEVDLDPPVEQFGMGTLGLGGSDSVRPFQRRNHVRLSVASPLEVNVFLRHGDHRDDHQKMLQGRYWRGRLVDISEGGAQVAIDSVEGATLGEGQMVQLEFRPEPTQLPLAFDAQIREILPTADGKNVCLGLQFIALEANPAGRQGLQRLCNSRSI